MNLQNKKIVLGITGGIAAYKSAELTRRLREAGAQVQVVMTKAAAEFITPLTLQAVSGNPVHQNLLDPNAEAAMGHIELARWADVVLVAPATADFMAKLANGLAGDLLNTLCLATTAPVVLAPAMNQQMWLNTATQENLARLKAHGVNMVGPADGSQACGEFGPGRMLEPAELINYLHHLFAPKTLAGKQVLITAGPTIEAIDPVRYIGNRSSGKMGFALAQAAVEADAEVTLISGPVHLPTPYQVRRIDVQTAQEMHDAVMVEAKKCAIFIAAAAVADYRVEKPKQQKIAKSASELTLKLVRNPDILAAVTQQFKKVFAVGFAAETHDVIKHAQTKLAVKHLAMIIANQVGEVGSGFDSDHNQATVIWPDGQKKLPLTTKKELAQELISIIAQHYKK